MVSTFTENINAVTKNVQRLMSEVSLEGTGSTYVRWGRTSCHGNDTEMIYAGYAGGSQHSHSGAGANFLCLPSDPLWGKYDDSSSSDTALVFGAEYEMEDPEAKLLFGKPLHDEDVPCALCRTVRASVAMIPGRNECYRGWTSEYSGYLSGGHYGHPAASEFICLDKNPETVTGGHGGHNGKLFYVAEAVCGSLKCPPYVNKRELTCVVCSK